MEIKNNLLVGVKFLQTPHTSGLIKDFKYLCLHEDEGASMAGTESWIMNPISKVSYHVLVGNNGEVTQFVPFNKRAYHAGKSTWKGLSDLNWYSIGLSFQNRNGEAFTQGELNKAVEVAKAIVREYGIKEIVRHRDISPGRKTDPHLGFPFDWFKEQVFGNSESDGKLDSKRTTSDLNLRQGAGTNFSVLEVLKSGSEVLVLSEQNGWSQVVVCSSRSIGFVSSKYIK